MVTDAENPGKRCRRTITIGDRLELNRPIDKSVGLVLSGMTQSNRNGSVVQKNQKKIGKPKTNFEYAYLCHYNGRKYLIAIECQSKRNNVTYSKLNFFISGGTQSLEHIIINNIQLSNENGEIINTLNEKNDKIIKILKNQNEYQQKIENLTHQLTQKNEEIRSVADAIEKLNCTLQDNPSIDLITFG